MPYDVDPELAKLESEGVISDAMYHVAEARIISYQCICLEDFQPDPTNEFRCLPKAGSRALRERQLAAAVGSLREWGQVGGVSIGKSSEQGASVVGDIAAGSVVGAVMALAGIVVAVGVTRRRRTASSTDTMTARVIGRVFSDFKDADDEIVVERSVIEA